jgi:hypothetical protein
MANLTLRQTKGSPLTFAEVDNNFTALNTELGEKALQTVTLTAGTGLTGGGTLAANRTFSLSSATQGSLAKAESSIQPSYQITAGAGLSGGGAMSGSSLSLAADFASEAEALAGTVDAKAMTPERTRQTLDQRPSGIPVKVLSTNSAYTALAVDQGYIIRLNTGYSGTITLPDTLPTGHAITVFNNLTTNVSIAAGSGASILVAGTGATGNKVLAAKGVVTAVNTGGTPRLWVLNGAGLS